MRKNNNTFEVFKNIIAVLYPIVIWVFLFNYIYMHIDCDADLLSWELIFLILSPFIIVFLQDVLLSWNEIIALKIGNIEVLKKSEDLSRKISHGTSLSSDEIEHIFKSLEGNDWLTLLLARNLLRVGLRRITCSEYLEKHERPSLVNLITENYERGRLKDKEKQHLDKLREVTVFVEWGSKSYEPKISDWSWALLNYKDILVKLFEKNV